MCACVLCPLVSLLCVLLSNYNLNRRISNFEILFKELYKDSESRIDRTNDMVCRLSECMTNAEHMLGVITQEYTRQLDKLQACRDNAMDQTKELTKATTILSTIATSPKTIVNNNTPN